MVFPCPLDLYFTEHKMLNARAGEGSPSHEIGDVGIEEYIRAYMREWLYI